MPRCIPPPWFPRLGADGADFDGALGAAEGRGPCGAGAADRCGALARGALGAAERCGALACGIERGA